MTYTAANQLAWSLTHDAPGSYTNLAATATWHWYDAQGLRVLTEVAPTSLTTYPALGPGAGTRTYYFYDGADVALTLYQAPTQPVKVAKRYLTGGLDQQLALRIYTTESGYLGALALLSNRQGTVLGAMRPNGLRETTVKSFSTDAFGKVAGADGAGTTNPEVGFAGASTGDPQGGFTYLRNRWYDPQTGRFLTQDPIGLAGGVNLYAYAGNNPVMFSDPFGLCPWHDVECWEDKMWAASGGTGFAGRVLAPLASTALELSGASGVDQSSKAAAGGSKMAMAALVLDIGSSAIPGGSEGKAGVRALIRDATENPGAWKSIASFVEKAVSKKARGGISIQRVIQNEAGDQLVEHTILNKAGEVVEQHFRPMLKPPVEP